MNTYIQDKLDTFEQFLMEKCPSHTNNSPEGFEKWLENLDIDELMDYAMDFRNKFLTDYHNHIVEKLLKHFDKLEHNDTNDSMENWRNYKFIRNNIVDCLQDTNPKE